MKILTLFLFLFFLFYSTADAATYIVTRTDDRNDKCVSGTDCSLREAVKAANQSPADDIINFSQNLNIVSVSMGEIVVTNNGDLNIVGSGANLLTIAGNNTSRIFSINSATATISGITITSGNGVGGLNNGNGGAIFAFDGSLTLNGVYITGNSAVSLSGSQTGGVEFQGGMHFITNSTLAANSSNFCGALNNNGGSLDILNSTISGNLATGNGGGICTGSSSKDLDDATNLQSVNLTNNTAFNGGGIWKYGNGSLELENSIVAGNFVTGGFSPEIKFDGDGNFISSGNNLIGDSTGDAANTENTVIYQASDILDSNPILGMLQNNGGSTPTHALLPGSPAINAGNNSEIFSRTDQRGFIRIVANTIDIGAYESNMPAITPTPTVTPTPTATPTPVVTPTPTPTVTPSPTPSVTPTPTPTSTPMPGCTYSINPSMQSFSASGGAGLFTLTTQIGCQYIATSSASFITITSNANGTDSENITFSVEQNRGEARTGEIRIGNLIFTVNQESLVKSRKRFRVF